MTFSQSFPTDKMIQSNVKVAACNNNNNYNGIFVYKPYLVLQEDESHTSSQYEQL